MPRPSLARAWSAIPVAASAALLLVALVAVLASRGDPNGSPAAATEDRASREETRDVVWLVALSGSALIFASWYAMTRRIEEPLATMTAAARDWARGELGARAPEHEPGGLGELAESMNVAADDFDERRQALVRRNRELEVVLASMVEGVLAADVEERVIDLNPSAAALLDVDPVAARGRPIQEIVRNPALQRFLARALAEDDPVEEEFTLRRRGARTVRARGSHLRDEGGRVAGAVIVLDDLTRVRRLESMRRDFVANVSHELKTPVTSIKGFVETLLEGGLEDREEAVKFLTIAARQADRLAGIIDDLLMLSRIEQDSEKREIALEDSPIRRTLESAAEACSIRANEKRAVVRIECDPELHWPVNAPLLEQAVVNLVDNALKYSEPEGEVRVGSRVEGGELVVSVADRGCGIDREHHPRLFERFYRVDKARSRKLGGTGLGLAIVKHIAQAHGGRPEVESRPGKGSVFSLRLPGRPPDLS